MGLRISHSAVTATICDDIFDNSSSDFQLGDGLALEGKKGGQEDSGRDLVLSYDHLSDFDPQVDWRWRNLDFGSKTPRVIMIGEEGDYDQGSGYYQGEGGVMKSEIELLPGEGRKFTGLGQRERNDFSVRSDVTRDLSHPLNLKVSESELAFTKPPRDFRGWLGKEFGPKPIDRWTCSFSSHGRPARQRNGGDEEARIGGFLLAIDYGMEPDNIKSIAQDEWFIGGTDLVPYDSAGVSLALTDREDMKRNQRIDYFRG
ncbi:hypothetical protein NPIL_118071 [Nephila pilipes]|uniref:Uncharacterized protein n=1 Tax=Nephila pilipes TaxID=299642 RepID=A0A8X6MRS2_NEPPI|nr:hypothetical protein NPIL_118071 [Nephila pilipes]